MAVLDRRRNVVVLRIVYDGPAASGKTTTVRALAKRLGRSAISPEEAGGRTLFFDWLDYTGGLFEGYQLRCQIVSVPGQAMLARRRNYLLGTADAVVYVSALTEANLSEAIQSLLNINENVDIHDGVPVGVLLQANKRDLPDCLPIASVDAACAAAGLNVAVVESTASEGIGVRETFVFAVRLALDRVREQIRKGTLKEDAPEIDGASDLLSHLKNQVDGISALDTESRLNRESSGVLESEREDADEGGELLNRIVGDHSSIQVPNGLQEPAAVENRTPQPPDQSVPGGLIWPAVEGRLHLANATARPPELVRIPSGWRASTQDAWRFYSKVDDVFQDVDLGRNYLISLARIHSSHDALLSIPRCVVLAEDGVGSWRLWQVAKERVTLRERLACNLDERDGKRVLKLLMDSARRLLELDTMVALVPESSLQVSLDTTGVFGGITQYVGEIHAESRKSEHVRLDLENEMRPVLTDWSAVGVDIRKELENAQATTLGADAGLIEMFLRILTVSTSRSE